MGRPLPLLFVFALIFSALFVLHAPLLRLPYFWDEAGYFIPAAHDLLLTGDVVPSSIPSNAHPPLVTAWLAMWWQLSGYTPAVTRIAMLLVAALALLAVYRLARRTAAMTVAVATVLCTALYPVFFSQSVMAHMDMAAAALCLWGLVFLVEQRRTAALVMFTLAPLAKETAVVVPAAIAAWELLWWGLRRRGRESVMAPPPKPLSQILLLGALPVAMLSLWFGYHWLRTGYALGNPEYIRYNVGMTLSPVRILLTALRRVWQLTGYMNLYLLTIPAALAMMFPPLRQHLSAEPARGVLDERRRIAIWVQMIFAVVVVAQVVTFSLVGGAVLARYLLPALPLVVLVCVSTLRRRVRWWPAVIAIVCGGFLLALFFNPPHRFPPEDNLAWRDYVVLHRQAADYLSKNHAGRAVLTAWPANDELAKPYLGYVRQPFAVARVEDFSLDSLAAARQFGSYDLVLLFSRKYEPPRKFALLDWWERRQERWFDRIADMPPELWAQQLGGEVVWRQARGGQWVAVVAVQRVEVAGSGVSGQESAKACKTDS